MIRLAVACAVAAGCTETIELDHNLAGLVSVDVEPAQSTLSVDLASAPQTLAYAATGQFDDGSTRDVTAYVRWSVDNAAPGTFAEPGTYVTSNGAGGHVTVTAATESGISATAALTIVETATIVDGVFPPPGDPATLFPPGAPAVTGDLMHAPAVLYPADGVMFPQGVSRTLVQYARGMQNDAFQLAFDSDVVHVTVWTGSDRWSADGPVWSLIAGSGISGPVQLSIDATASTNPTTIYGAPPIALAFSRDAPAGEIDYWSAATTGIMHGALASITATKLYPSDGTCVGCHAISRDGHQLALGYGGETLQTVDAATLAPIIPATAKLPMGWATFSPDGTRVLVADKGVLTLYDAASGERVGAGRVALPPMTFATHPDWSPDGAFVAVAVTSMAPTNMDVKSASIARLPFANDAFGAPQILVAAAGGMDNNYFPRYSPDGNAIAYVHATGTSHGAATAELRLVAAGGGTPASLQHASLAMAADTMPAWAPVAGDHAWLAFASERAYGAVLPMGGRPQIWIAAIALGGGGDPSAAAFWLPCQDISVLNNNPVWTGTSSSGTDFVRTSDTRK